MDDFQKGVMLYLRILIAAIYMFLALGSPAYAGQPERTSPQFQKAGNFDMGILNSALVKAKKDAVRLKKTHPGNAYKREGEAQAEKLYEFYESPEFQKRLSRETERVKKEVFGNEIDSYYKDLLGEKGKREQKEKDQKKKMQRLSPNERIYLFISSSVPEMTLRTYTEQIAGLRDKNIVVLMRGFIDGMHKIGPTLKFIGELLAKDPACGQRCGDYGVNVEVDPLLFRRYGIEQVPAVVYVPDIEVDRPGSEGLGQNAKVGRSYTFYGDSTLSNCFERINEQAKSASLAAVIKGLKQGFYR